MRVLLSIYTGKPRKFSSLETPPRTLHPRPFQLGSGLSHLLPCICLECSRDHVIFFFWQEPLWLSNKHTTIFSAISKQTPLEGKWKDSKDIWRGGGRAYFNLRSGEKINVTGILCFCVSWRLPYFITISSFYKGSPANLGEIEVFQFQENRKAHLGSLCNGVCHSFTKVRGRSHFCWRLNTRRTCCLLLCYRLILKSDFRTECDFVKGHKLFESQFVSRHKKAILVQMAPLWISQPLNQNQSMHAVTVMRTVNSIPVDVVAIANGTLIRLRIFEWDKKGFFLCFWYGRTDTECSLHVRQW